jgi:hypothetical protein
VGKSKVALTSVPLVTAGEGNKGVGVTVGSATVSVTTVATLTVEIVAEAVTTGVSAAASVSVEATEGATVGVSLGSSASATLFVAGNVTISVAVGPMSPGSTRILCTTKTIRNPTRRIRRKAYLPKSYRHIERGGRRCAITYSPSALGFACEALPFASM